MIDPSILVALLAGLAMGSVVAALIWLGRRRGGEAVVRERLTQREGQLAEAQREIARARAELGEVRSLLQEEGERRSAAEERARRVAVLEEQAARREEVVDRLQAERAERLAKISHLETRLVDEKASVEKQLELLAKARQELSDTFQALSSRALKESNRSFLELAHETLERYQTEARTDLDRRRDAVQNLVDPIKESLGKVDAHVRELEQARKQAYGSIRAQVENLVSSQRVLQDETRKLSQALRAPNVRGRWGEIQLRRVVEIAGMLPHCDFVEQATVGADDQRLRPDLIVLLPGDKSVVVDSKAPLSAYLEAHEAEDEELRRTLLAQHARQLRDHLNKLSQKSYFDQFANTPEFVVMFLPGESFFSSALEHDPTLIEDGVQRGVILATPTTLIALLRAVSYGWRHERLAESAQAISALGKQMHERLRVVSEHLHKLGTHLERAVSGYNQAIGSFESRVLVTARRFGELGISTPREIPELTPVETGPRALQASDWEDEG